MVTPTVYQFPAIGACLPCNQLFLVTTPDTRCLFCGGLPSTIHPFAQPLRSGLAAPDEPPPPAAEPTAPTIIGVTCPHCHQNLQLSITDTEISVIPPPTPLPAEEAAPVDATPAAAASDAGPTEPPPAMAQDAAGDTIEGPSTETPPTPAMGRDFYGNPIPGQLVAPESTPPEEPLP
jgi:hypothetical protein